MYDAIVIGGGFYGAAIAIYLKTCRHFAKVLLVEQGPDLMLHASYNNQARVHNGYHYPRSFTTGFRSRVNMPRFIQDYPGAVKQDFTKLYAIARNNSKITARQFERFCYEIGAKLEPASEVYKNLFEKRLIEEVFLAEEYVFDAKKLAQWAQRELLESGVSVRLNTHVQGVEKIQGTLSVMCGDTSPESCHYLFNCTYSGLNQLGGEFPGTQVKLKHEIAEMALMKVPSKLAGLGITVMDGAFFSLMPFPAKGLHTLSHVRYTPHFSWLDKADIDPYQKLASYNHETRVDRMVRDSSRYLPVLAEAQYLESLYEVKTVLVKNESDDGRPILFERHATLPNCFSILGGKIDNIYDVLEKLDEENFSIN